MFEGVWVEMSFLNTVENFVLFDDAFNFVIGDGTLMHTQESVTKV